MKQLNTPICKSNFPENWKIVEEERQKAKKKYRVSNGASFVSNMVFSILSFISINGILHDHLPGAYSRFLEDFPVLIPLWRRFSALFLKSGQSWAVQLGLTALVLYGICFAVNSVCALILSCSHRSDISVLPSGTVKENASAMLAMAKEARQYAHGTIIRGSAVWALFFLICQFSLLGFYCVTEIGSLNALIAISTKSVMELLSSCLTNPAVYATVRTAVFVPSLILFALALFLCYILISMIHALSVQFLYRYRVPYSFVADVEAYYLFCDEDFGTMSNEEIQAMLAERSDEICEKAAKQERRGLYKQARELYGQAAYSGNLHAMEEYARHWLVLKAKDPARYWLQKCADTGKASKSVLKNLRRIKRNRKVSAEYTK